MFRPNITTARMVAMLDGLRLFGIGASWGGYESLVLPSTSVARALGRPFAGPTARFHVGLEAVEDLIADLDRAFVVLR